MSSTRTVVGRRLAESVGLASAKPDEDMLSAGTKLTELEKEVRTLRAVLETANRAATQQVAAARSQMSSLVATLSSRLLRPGVEGEFFASSPLCMLISMTRFRESLLRPLPR